MFPLYSPHLSHASPTSPKGEPIFAPADRLPLPLFPQVCPGLQWRDQRYSVLSALAKPLCEPQFPQCKMGACPHPTSRTCLWGTREGVPPTRTSV